MHASVFRGTHHEMGVQQGKAFKDALARGARAFTRLEALHTMKPRLLPAGLFLHVAGTIAMKRFKPLFKVHAPNQAARIEGIAEGAGMSERLLWFFTAAELVLGENDYEVPIPSGCTSVLLDGSMMTTAHVTVARNFDYASFVVPFLRARRNEPADGLVSFDITAAPLPGTFNGMNEAGLFISTNEAFPVAQGIRHPGLPASVLIQEALETCQTTREAVALFSRAPRGSCNIVTLADKGGDLACLEYTSTDIHEIRPGKGERYLVATNHYVSPGLAAIDLPRAAVFGKMAPRSLRGTCINETSHQRRATVQRLLAAATPGHVDRDFLVALLRDHSACNGTGGMETICHHDPENISAASMVFDLETRAAWACVGSPCQHEFEPVAFDQVDAP